VPHLAYKFRLYPNANQTRELGSQLETLRQVYNAGLAWWKDAYEREKLDERIIPRRPKKNGDGETKRGILETLYPIFADLRNFQIADQKAGGDGPHWLTRVAAVPIRDTLKRLQKAFENFYRRLADKKDKAGFPRFKARNRLCSIPFDNYPQGGCILRNAEGKTLTGEVAELRGNRVDVFGVGRIKVKSHRLIVGKIKTVAIVREPDGKWYAVFTCEVPAKEVPPKEGAAVGIDVGLEHFLTTSDGEHEANPRFYKKELKRLRRLQRSASRKVEAAKKAKAKFRERKNLQKSFREVARLHVRVKNLRKEHHHQVTNRLVDRYATVCAEKLNVQGMVRNGKLSRSIQDAGWSGFLNTLKLKAERAGVRFVEVDARGTSQTCPECNGEARKDLRVRTHNCPHCGYIAHRDHAAARVILARGTIPNGAGSVPARHNSGVTSGAGRKLPSLRPPLQRPARGGKKAHASRPPKSNPLAIATLFDGLG
jgi:putative transposase